MLKSIKDTLDLQQAMAPQTLSASGTSDAIDTSNIGSLSFAVSVGAFAFDNTNKLNLKMLESDTASGTYTDVSGDDIFDAEDAANKIAKILDSTDDQNTVHMVHYRGGKRFVKLNVVEVGTVSVPLAATAVKGHLGLNPPA